WRDGATAGRQRQSICPTGIASSGGLPREGPATSAERSGQAPRLGDVVFPTRKSRLLNEVAALFDRGTGAPRHERHRARRVLRRAVDELVGINHVNQYVPLGVTATHDLHLLEEHRAALPEHIAALLHLVLEMDRPVLPAGQ